MQQRHFSNVLHFVVMAFICFSFTLLLAFSVILL